MTRRALPVIAVALVVSLAVGLLIGGRVGYYEAIGLLGCITIILVSKWLGDVALSQPEDLYPLDIPPTDEEDLRG